MRACERGWHGDQTQITSELMMDFFTPLPLTVSLRYFYQCANGYPTPPPSQCGRGRHTSIAASARSHFPPSSFRLSFSLCRVLNFNEAASAAKAATRKRNYCARATAENSGGGAEGRGRRRGLRKGGSGAGLRSWTTARSITMPRNVTNANFKFWYKQIYPFDW